jgi:DNA-binding MarR family transcriptional regulator
MSIREPRRPRGAKSAKLPLSISRAALLADGSDREFRRLIYRMLITESRLIAIRKAIAQQVGVSGTQYSIMMTILHVEGEAGISIGALADYLEVTGAHITGEVRRLAALGLVRKTINPDDMRGVQVRLSADGHRRLLAAFDYIRSVNNILFEGVSSEEFRALGGFYKKFIRNTSLAQAWTRRSSGRRESTAA